MSRHIPKAHRVNSWRAAHWEISRAVSFIRNTCTLTHLYSYLIGRSCGSSTMHTVINVQVKKFSWCAHQTSEWGKNVVPNGMVWVFHKLRFSNTTVVYTEWCKKQNTSYFEVSEGWNTVLIRQERNLMVFCCCSTPHLKVWCFAHAKMLLPHDSLIG